MWIFKTPLRDWVSFLKNKFLTSKYVIKGKCKKCGQCCENILFSDEDGYVKTLEHFESLKKHNIRYHHFVTSGKIDEKEGQFSEQDYDNPKHQAGALLFRCKSLGEDKKCRQYFFRSIYCRDYPSINKNFISSGGTTLDGCGFYFDVDKKFKDYLNMR